MGLSAYTFERHSNLQILLVIQNELDPSYSKSFTRINEVLIKRTAVYLILRS